MATEQITRGSHYLPRTYLKHFLLDDALFMYKKGEKFFASGATEDKRIVAVRGESGLNNVAKENNLYALEAQGLDPNAVEKLFQEMVENDFNDLLAQGDGLAVGTRLGTELKRKLSLLMATMRIRTPQFKSEVDAMSTGFTKANMKRAMEHINREEFRKEWEAETGKKLSDELLDQAVETFKSEKYDVTWPNALFLKIALSSIEMHADIFWNMKMNLLKAPRGACFITSDNPVVHFVPQDKVNFYNNYKSLMSPFTEVFFPLSKTMSLYLCRAKDIGETVQAVDPEMTEIINYNISVNSKDFIFSPQKMESLKKFADSYIPYPFKLTTR